MQLKLKSRDRRFLRYGQILYDAEIPEPDLLFDNIMAKIIYGAFDGATYSVLDK